MPGVRKRWCVVVVFADGREVILRDFAFIHQAQAKALFYGKVDLYPQRKYRIEIRQMEVERDVNPY